MRDQLRSLEGQLIFIQGRIKNYSHRNGHRYVCLQRPLVIPWDGNEPLQESFTHKAIEGIEHLWVETSQSDKINMMQHVLSCSRVQWYTRKDGSIDLGTEPLHVLYNHDGQINDLIKAREAGQFHRNHGDSYFDDQLEFCDVYLDLLTNQGRRGKLNKPEWIYSQFYSISWLIDWYRGYKAELQSAQKHFNRAQRKVAQQVARGRCRSAGGFSDLLR